MNLQKISADFNFKSAKILSLPKTSEAYALFANNFEKAMALSVDFKYIFLDTNVLLNYYGMSKSEKGKLLDFFKLNKDRIFLTSQVEKEFLRNRLGTIKKDLDAPLESLHKDYQSSCSAAKNAIKSYMDSRKNTFSNDFPSIWEQLQNVSENLDVLLNDTDLNAAIINAGKETTIAHKNISLDDELLKVASLFNITPPLSTEEIDIIKKDYDELYNLYEAGPAKDQWKLVFPGSGDKKEKPNDPYGDFIIYHEIIKKMSEFDTDAIFLTNEKSKSDWINSDKSPIIHYVNKTFSLTNKILYILHAEKPLKVSFENIHKRRVEEGKATLESTVVTIDKKNGYGFLYKKDGNLYFNKASLRVPEEFEGLEKNSCLTYSLNKNADDNYIATNLKRVFYNFADPNFVVEEGYISEMYVAKHFGYIDCDDKSLYFHVSALEDSEHIGFLEKGVVVQFIRGKDNNGHEIVRLMRLAVSIAEVNS